MAKGEQKVYMPLIIGDWLKGTRGMKAEVKGIYIDLLLFQWDNGFIPSDMDELILINPEIPRVWEKVKVKFVEAGPGKLVNQKCEEVRAFWKKQKSNGKTGGRPKKQNPNDNPTKNLNHNPNNNLHNDLDIDNESEVEFKGFGGTGEKEVLSFPYDDEIFMQVWEVWVNYRIEIKKPYQTFSSIQIELQELGKLGLEKSIYLINKALKNGWKNITDDGTFERTKSKSDYHGNKARVSELNSASRSILSEPNRFTPKGSDPE